MNINSKALKGEIARLMESAAGRLSGRSPEDDELSKKLRAMTERLLGFSDSAKMREQRSIAGKLAVQRKLERGQPLFTKEAHAKSQQAQRELRAAGKFPEPLRGPDGHFIKSKP